MASVNSGGAHGSDEVVRIFAIRRAIESNNRSFYRGRVVWRLTEFIGSAEKLENQFRHGIDVIGFDDRQNVHR